MVSSTWSGHLVNVNKACEGRLGAARPFTTDIIATQYITADKLEVTAIFTSQEVSTSFPN